MMLHGAMTARAFEAYVEQCLVPELRPGDVVVLDKLNAQASVAKYPAGQGRGDEGAEGG